MDKFNTLGQLEKYLINEMQSKNLSPLDTVTNNTVVILQHQNLFRLSAKDAEILQGTTYSYCEELSEVKGELLFDYCQLKLEHYLHYRSINTFKKYLLGKS